MRWIISAIFAPVRSCRMRFPDVSTYSFVGCQLRINKQPEKMYGEENDGHRPPVEGRAIEYFRINIECIAITQYAYQEETVGNINAEADWKRIPLLKVGTHITRAEHKNREYDGHRVVQEP